MATEFLKKYTSIKCHGQFKYEFDPKSLTYLSFNGLKGRKSLSLWALWAFCNGNLIGNSSCSKSLASIIGTLLSLAYLTGALRKYRYPIKSDLTKKQQQNKKQNKNKKTKNNKNSVDCHWDGKIQFYSITYYLPFSF